MWYPTIRKPVAIEPFVEKEIEFFPSVATLRILERESACLWRLQTAYSYRQAFVQPFKNYKVKLYQEPADAKRPHTFVLVLSSEQGCEVTHAKLYDHEEER